MELRGGTVIKPGLRGRERRRKRPIRVGEEWMRTHLDDVRLRHARSFERRLGLGPVPKECGPSFVYADEGISRHLRARARAEIDR